MLHRKIPGFTQFATVQCRPLDHEPAHARRQLARDDRKAVNRDEGPLVAVADMEMGRTMVVIMRTMVVIIERDDDPKKAAQLGHQTTISPTRGAHGYPASVRA